MEKGNRWVFTINNWTEEKFLLKLIEPLEIKYLVYGKEIAPTTGTRHLQGFFKCKMCSRKKVMKHGLIVEIDEETGQETLSNLWSYLAIARGSDDDNFRYCTKSGDFREIRSRTQQLDQAINRRTRMLTLQNDWLHMTAEQFNDKWPVESVLWRSKLKNWESDVYRCSKPWEGTLASKNYWIWGLPGTGKSRWVRQQCNIEWIYPKQNNKWWGGFESNLHKIVVFEDFPEDGKYLAQYMKIRADRYSFIDEVKGGSISINPGSFFLIVTSNFQIESIFDDTDAAAIKRRFTVIEMKTDSIFKDTRLDFEILLK